MKKMMLRLVMLLMAALLACAPAMAEVDAFTSASVTDFYGDNALTGDELMTYVNAEGKRLQAPEQPEDRAADEPAPDAPDSEDSAADAPTQDV